MCPANSRQIGVGFEWPPVRKVSILPSAHCAMSTFLFVVEEFTRSSGIVRAPSTSAALKESVHSARQGIK